MRNWKKFMLVAVLTLAAAMVLAGPVLAADKKVKAAWVYVGPIGDHGWTYAHDQGRLAVEKKLGIETAFIESVMEADAERVIAKFARDGYSPIFTTSFGFMDPTLAAAKKFPDTIFMHCSGFKRAPNMGTYFSRAYQSRYLTGLVAGAMTKSNIIGYVNAFPIPECIRLGSAFAIGVREGQPQGRGPQRLHQLLDRRAQGQGSGQGPAFRGSRRDHPGRGHARPSGGGQGSRQVVHRLGFGHGLPGPGGHSDLGPAPLGR